MGVHPSRHEKEWKQTNRQTNKQTQKKTNKHKQTNQNNYRAFVISMNKAGGRGGLCLRQGVNAPGAVAFAHGGLRPSRALQSFYVKTNYKTENS